MSEPTVGFKSSLSPQSSFLQRILENIESVRAASHVRLGAPLAAGALPIHLLEKRKTTGFSAHVGSTAVHVLLFAALFLLVTRPPFADRLTRIRVNTPLQRLFYPVATPSQSIDASHLGISGSSGDRNLLPPTNGDPAPYSRIVFAAPRPSDSQTHKLPVETSIFAADAPEFPTQVNDPGLPWMPVKNGSGGPGTHGIGVGEDHGIGDTGGDGVGQGSDRGPYAVAASPVSCKYCPDPQYSDEARKTKLQGHVMLRVLVGPDGRAKEIQLAHGLGMGLDENAVQAVQGWQFFPARDSARRPVSSWITIEAVFRLF